MTNVSSVSGAPTRCSNDVNQIPATLPEPTPFTIHVRSKAGPDSVSAPPPPSIVIDAPDPPPTIDNQSSPAPPTIARLRPNGARSAPSEPVNETWAAEIVNT